MEFFLEKTPDLGSDEAKALDGLERVVIGLLSLLGYAARRDEVFDFLTVELLDAQKPFRRKTS